MKILRYTLLISLFFALFSLGYVKEYLSVQLNNFLKLIHQSETDSYTIESLESIIYLSKWIMTFLLLVIYTILGVTIIHLFLRNNQYTKLAILSYVILIISAILIQFAGTFYLSYETGYTLAHRITNFIQTPLPVLIFILGSYVQIRIKK